MSASDPDLGDDSGNTQGQNVFGELEACEDYEVGFTHEELEKILNADFWSVEERFQDWDSNEVIEDAFG